MIEVVLELLLTLFGETLLDSLVHKFAGSDRAMRMALRIVIFAGLGAFVGGLSLLLFPIHFIRDADLRLVTLIVTPFLAGAIFAGVGRRRLRHEKHVSALETFWPAYAFALAMALVRYFGAG